jgi:hypothetical protein
MAGGKFCAQLIAVHGNGLVEVTQLIALHQLVGVFVLGF